MAAFTAAAKAEKQLKELLKLPANKRCADCTGTGSLARSRCTARPVDSSARPDARRRGARRQAPQYVCVNFGTFICTNCATAQCAPRAGASLS